MSKLECYIVRDLLSLYADEACEEQTAVAVAEHLESCAACQRLLNQMLSAESIPPVSPVPVFRRTERTVLGLILAAAVMLACFGLNLGGAWMGGPATPLQAMATGCYLLFWAVFTILSRNYLPLLRISRVLSLLTLFSGAVSLICRLLKAGYILAALASVFASVPFYGLRIVMGWTELYAVATAAGLLWWLCTGKLLRKLKATLTFEG